MVICRCFIVMASISFGWSVSAETTVLGRWCDQLVPTMRGFDRIITLRINGNGAIEAFSEFADGSELLQDVEELPDSVFAILESGAGDRMRISSTSGELQLLDRDGLIRTARRLENEPVVNDCIK